jgi:hypothetical protein
MSRVNIHGADYPIGKVFSDEFVFSIPRLIEKLPSWRQRILFPAAEIQLCILRRSPFLQTPHQLLRVYMPLAHAAAPSPQIHCDCELTQPEPFDLSPLIGQPVEPTLYEHYQTSSGNA